MTRFKVCLRSYETSFTVFFITLIKYIGIEETYHSLGNHGKAGGGEDDDVSPVPEHRKSGLIEALEKRNPDYNATIRCSFF
jgi:hypothetical protein